MIGELDSDVVVRYFSGKNILITGSTGFLGKGTDPSSCMHELVQLVLFQGVCTMHGRLIITGGACFLHYRLFVVLVEKILRVQPDVKKLFLLIRAADVESAKQRVETEVKTKYFSLFFLPS
jgi:fatty acyl-CoA reductase